MKNLNWTNSRCREAYYFNKAIKNIIIDYWPDAKVELGREVIGYKKPDILVKKGSCRIPIEVKSSKYGCFYLDGSDSEVILKYNGLNFSRDYRSQVLAALREYGISLVLVAAQMNQPSPCCRKDLLGPVILADCKDIEKSLDMAERYLYNLQYGSVALI